MRTEGQTLRNRCAENETPCQLFRHLYSEVEQKKETIITFTETHKLYKRFNNIKRNCERGPKRTMMLPWADTTNVM